MKSTVELLQGAIRLGYGRIEIKSSALLERLGSAG